MTAFVGRYARDQENWELGHYCPLGKKTKSPDRTILECEACEKF